MRVIAVAHQLLVIAYYLVERIQRGIVDVRSEYALTFVLVFGLTGIYFGFPAVVNPLFRLDPSDRYTDTVLDGLSQLHFGRFGWLTEVMWSIVGLAPAVLALTGVFICCRRIIYKKPSNPNVDQG